MGANRAELVEAFVSNYDKMTFVKVGTTLVYTAGVYSMEITNNIMAVYEDMSGEKTQKISITNDKIKTIYDAIWFELTNEEVSEFEMLMINHLINL